MLLYLFLSASLADTVPSCAVSALAIGVHRPLKLAGGMEMNNLLNQTGSLRLLSSLSCTYVYIMVPVLIKQCSVLTAAAA